MDIIAVHQDNLIVANKHLKGELFAELVEESERLGFGEGLYKNGPTIVSMPVKQFFEQEIDFKLYVPISEYVETADTDFTWQKSLDISKAVSVRMPFGDKVEEGVRQLQKYLEDHKKQTPERMFFVLTPVYAQYWVDIVMPLSKVEEK